MIPAQAVEAADAAYRNTVPTGDGSYQHRAIRAAIEAAAPYIRAEALETAAAAIQREGDPRDTLTVNWLKARAGAELSHAN